MVNYSLDKYSRRLASEAASSGIFAQATGLYADALRLAEQSDATALLALFEGQRALTLWRLLASSQVRPANDDLQTSPPEYAAGSGLGSSAAEPGAGQAAAPSPQAALAEQQLEQDLARYGAAVLGGRQTSGALPDLEALVPQAPLDLPRVRAILGQAFGAAWTVLAYSFDNGVLRRIVLSDGTLQADAIDDSRALRWLIEQAALATFRRYTYADVPLAQGLTARPWERLVQLADLLLPQAVRERLHPEHRLLVVPSGPLHSLPWAALRLNDAWLAEGAIIQLLPSLSLAPLLAARRPQGRAALAVGCGTFGDRAAALPAVAGELAAIARRWPGPTTLLQDAAATAAGLLAAVTAGRPALVHLASHARLLPSRSLAAHIKLWDRDLRLPELVGVGLDGALVVLSACEGAAADVLPGEEVLSLSWGLLAGGAGAVLASLWPVGDQQTTPLMDALYAELAPGYDPALALARAQRRLLAAGDPEASSAEIWGSFLTVGGLWT